jgi:hypothetical protein
MLDTGLLCLQPANEVDHIVPGNDHSDANLRCICRWHHQRKSSSEGGRARAAQKRSSASKLRRRQEAHPGLL